MPGRSGTAGLLGREREQAELYDALSHALTGSPRVVVVAGEAGVGKTTLVTDLVRRAEELGFAVGTGHCLDIEADISFAPVIEAVRPLVAEVADLESRPFARRMRALLDPAAPRSTEQLHLLDDLRLTVLEAAAAGPVLLLLEDLHWADTSTRDLALALARRARGRLMLVCTVRTDDLHRRHPARAALAEISRAPGGRRVDLGPLDRDSIAAIVAAIGRAPADPATLSVVLERSGGNPLYAEELAAVGAGPMPDQLSDLFLARAEALSDGPGELLRLAAVDGTQVEVQTLGELSGLDHDRVDACVHDLLDANLLRRSGDTVAFWHPLLRQAVYDDLLPDERTRLHAELARILQVHADDDPEPRLSVLSRVAYHWSAAGDSAHALVASERAGVVAQRVGVAESVSHFERALSLWDAVPDAEALVGRTEIDLVHSLAGAVLGQGDGERWHALNRRAVDMLEPDTDPLVACQTHAALAFSALNIDDTADAPEAVRLALEYAGESPSEERAYALGAQTLLHCVNGRFAATLAAADRAIEAAQEVGADRAFLLDQMFKSEALLCLGRIDEACELAERRVEVARSLGWPGEALYCVQILVSRLLYAGRVQEAGSVARAGRQEGLRAGLAAPAAHCGAALLQALIWGGHLDDAEHLLSELGDLGLDDPWGEERADLALARGGVASVQGSLPPRWNEVPPTGPPLEPFEVLSVFQIAAQADDRARCLRTAGYFLSLVESWDSPLLAAAAARIGFQALTLAGSPPEPRISVLRNEALRELDRAEKGLTDEWRPTYFGVQLALAEGYAAREAGRSGISHFREAARLSGPFGDFFALEPRLELAQELLARGSREEGRELLVDCWSAARNMGAAGLERRAARLATRARVPLPESASTDGPLSRLTPREREVLDALSAGATNRAIAEELVISEKTVSVHVSNVLAKLGVENRGAAAALARSARG
jgi:ATP/maltotriose-dependent transcriptional regulator MalT